MKAKLFVLIIICAAYRIKAFDGVRHYDQYSVYRLTPNNEKQLKFLHDLAMTTTEYDFWSYPTSVNSHVDIMVAPQMKSTFANMMSAERIINKTLITDVERAIIGQKARNATYINPGFKEVIPGFYTQYQRLDAIYRFLELIHESAPAITAIETIGRSTQNREIRLIKIGINYNSNAKPIVFLDSNIHAREWITSATTCYFIEHLIDGYKTRNAAIVDLLTKIDFYIAPVINPDGFEYTHTNERMWRKTRSPNTNSNCIGTDPNRNWSFQWSGPGTSNNPCSDIYHGPTAFSEPETKAVSDYMLGVSSRTIVYLAVHSYSQMWLYPWGYTSELTPDDAQLEARAVTAVNALKAIYGTQYVYGTGTNVLYAAAGAADDWGYAVARVKYSYTVELRDTGEYGFALPPEQIIPSGVESVEAFKAIAIDALNNP